MAEVVDAFEVPAEVAERDAMAFIHTCIERGILHACEEPQPIDLSVVVPSAAGVADRSGK